MEIVLKAVIGAVIVVVIHFLAQTRNFYIAGLVPLFPTFTIIAHLIVGTERATVELQKTILFGMVSMLPYLIYLFSLYHLVKRVSLAPAVTYAAVLWVISATLLIFAWNRIV